MNAINVTEHSEQQLLCYSTFVSGSTLNRDTPKTAKGILPMLKGKEPMIGGAERKSNKQVLADPALANVKC